MDDVGDRSCREPESSIDCEKRCVFAGNGCACWPHDASSIRYEGHANVERPASLQKAQRWQEALNHEV